MSQKWDDNFLQFARLLDEICAVGLSKEQLEQIGESMDLPQAPLNDLFERARQQWEQIKKGREPMRYDTAAAQKLRETGDIDAVIGGSDEVVLAFDEAEAKGVVKMRAGAYGPAIILGHQANKEIGYVDLFYYSRCGKERSVPRTQLLFFDPAHDEPLVKVIYFDDGRVRVSLHDNAARMPDADEAGIMGDVLFGLPEAT
jgi:hypothetical protein